MPASPGPGTVEENDSPVSHSWTVLSLALTDELRAFINQNCGEGTLYATPSEFVRDILRRHKLQLEAGEVRDAIVEGYQDAIAGRTVAFDGDLTGMLKKAQK